MSIILFVTVGELNSYLSTLSGALLCSANGEKSDRHLASEQSLISETYRVCIEMLIYVKLSAWILMPTGGEGHLHLSVPLSDMLTRHYVLFTRMSRSLLDYC